MTVPNLGTLILEMAASEEVEKKSEEILERARAAWPLDPGAFLLGMGVGQWVAIGKSDAEVLALVTLALGKIRAFLPDLERDLDLGHDRDLKPKGPPS